MSLASKYSHLTNIDPKVQDYNVLFQVEHSENLNMSYHFTISKKKKAKFLRAWKVLDWPPITVRRIIHNRTVIVRGAGSGTSWIGSLGVFNVDTLDQLGVHSILSALRFMCPKNGLKNGAWKVIELKAIKTTCASIPNIWRKKRPIRF